MRASIREISADIMFMMRPTENSVRAAGDRRNDFRYMVAIRAVRMFKPMFMTMRKYKFCSVVWVHANRLGEWTQTSVNAKGKGQEARVRL
jgi:hypothetical protein